MSRKENELKRITLQPLWGVRQEKNSQASHFYDKNRSQTKYTDSGQSLKREHALAAAKVSPVVPLFKSEQKILHELKWP